MTNNIGVTLAATATGVTGGVGTALLIAFNGLQLGTIFASLSSFAMAMKLFDFVVAHGILELSVILVAGGCGFYIADGIINPGVLTRTRSLQRRAEELIELVVFNGISLVAAGTVEGFVSPYTSIPFFIKLALGLTLGAVYWSILLGIWSKKSRSA